MIELYTWNTPNGQKIPIFLEEAEIPYTLHPVNIGKGEQHNPDFLKINPNGKIPAIVDTEGSDGQSIAIFESGAILLYLADKVKKLIPTDPQGRAAALEWLFFQVGGVGPMFGQLGFFKRSQPPNEPAIERYTKETKRLLAVLEGELAQREFLAGEYSIADIAHYGWLRGLERLEIPLDEAPNVKRWLDTLTARPAVERAMQKLKDAAA